MIVARPVGVVELDDDVIPDALNPMVEPLLIGERLVLAAFRMGFDFIGRTVDDIDPAAVCLPARDAAEEMLVDVANPAVVSKTPPPKSAAPELFQSKFFLFLPKEIIS